VKLENEQGALWLALDHSTEDYEIVVVGSRKLSSERDKLKIHSDSLQAELAQARSDVESVFLIWKQWLHRSKPTVLRLAPRVKRV
jgi:hypothetical protein